MIGGLIVFIIWLSICFGLPIGFGYWHWKKNDKDKSLWWYICWCIPEVR